MRAKNLYIQQRAIQLEMAQRERLMRFLILLTIPLLHFQIIEVSGWPLTIAPFSCLALLLLSSPTASPSAVKWFLGLSSYPILALIFQSTTSSFQLVAFARTYLMYTAFLLFCIGALQASPSRTHSNWSPFAWLTFFTAAIAILQVLSYEVLGTERLFNLFGDHQYLGMPYQLDTWRTDALFIRAPGLYLEPSYCALVLLFLIVTYRVTGGSNLLVFASGAGGILATGSATGIGVGILLLVAELMPAFQRRADRQSSIKLLLLILGVLGASYLALLPESLLWRIGEIRIEGTSGYNRYIFPLAILKDVLVFSPLGSPFGSSQVVMASYASLWVGGTRPQIDNGLYLLIFYFGVPGLLAVVIAIYLCSIRIISTHGWQRYPLIFLPCSLIFNGSIFSPEYAFMLMCLLIEVKRRLESEYE